MQYFTHAPRRGLQTASCPRVEGLPRDSSDLLWMEPTAQVNEVFTIKVAAVRWDEFLGKPDAEDNEPVLVIDLPPLRSILEIRQLP